MTVLPFNGSRVQAAPAPPVTGDCYAVALGFALANWRAQLVLCHGVIANPQGTVEHAWLESRDGKRVLDVASGEAGHIADWIALRQPTAVRRYDVPTACRLALTTGHCGPWGDNHFPDRGHWDRPRACARVVALLGLGFQPGGVTVFSRSRRQGPPASSNLSTRVEG